MCSVDALVAEDAVDREVACGPGIGGEFMEHVGRDSRGVSAEDEFEGFVVIVGIAIAYGAILASFVDLFHVLEILLVVLLRLLW